MIICIPIFSQHFCAYAYKTVQCIEIEECIFCRPTIERISKRESEHRTVKEHHHHRNFDAFQTEIGRESITKYMKGNSFKVCKLRMQKHRILGERIRV